MMATLNNLTQDRAAFRISSFTLAAFPWPSILAKMLGFRVEDLGLRAFTFWSFEAAFLLIT